ncbi:MAG TPA: AI-2E family transporter [Candidatus Polarisedimenticolaceae bacterium]|nr:AI-2E family transporter [Candidatus Polarisedimenticolaceae bacterium]
MPEPVEAPQPVAPSTRDLARRTAVQVVVVLAALCIASMLWYGRQVVLLLFAAVLLGVALQGLAAPLSRRARVPYWAALTLVILVLAGALAGLGAIIGPRLQDQVSVLRRELPSALDGMEERLRQYDWGEEAIERTEDLQQSVSRLEGRTLWRRIAGIFSTLLGGVVAVAVIVVVGIYLAAGGPRYVEALVRLFPQHRRGRMTDVFRQVVRFLRWWLLGRFVTMVFVGVVTGVGLALLGVPLALTFGILVGLLDFVPNVGPVLAAAPAVLLALVQRPSLALWVVLLYTAVQAVEAYLLTPMVERRTVSLEPALIVAAQLFAAVFLGALGVLLASPITAVVLVLVRMLYLEDVLGESAR